MSNVATKEQLLKNAGYTYNFNRELYLNRESKKAFSVEFIEDNSEEELAKRIQEPGAAEWRFFFSEPPSPAVERALANVLG